MEIEGKKKKNKPIIISNHHLKLPSSQQNLIYKQQVLQR
jgi:hypothetical protein